MNAAALPSPANMSDWKHCAPYFAVAILLHLAVLAWTGAMAAGELEIPPVRQIKVHLLETVAVPPIVQAPPASPSGPAPPQRERPQKPQRAILAVPAKNVPEPTAFSVSPTQTAPVVPSATVAENSAPAAPVSYSPARFNAAYLHNPSPVFPPLSRRLGDALEQLVFGCCALLEGVALPDGLAEASFDIAGGPFRLILAHEDGPVTLIHDGEAIELVGEWSVRGRAVRNRVETGSLSTVRVLVDVGLIEIYADGGRWCGTKRLDSDKPVTAIRLEADARTITRAEVWHLRAQQGAPRPDRGQGTDAGRNQKWPLSS